MRTDAAVEEGFISLRGHKVWYSVVGEREEPGRRPLICAHGGPGCTHDYFAPLEDVTSTGRRVVLYDQLGGGKSDHVHDPSFWTMGLFVEELGVLRDALGLDNVHLLGHSWGGMLAMEYALTQPAGLESLILSDTTASVPQMAAETARLVAALPAGDQETIRRCEAEGTTDSPEYEEACRAFSRRHAGGHIDPKPPWVAEAFAKMDGDEVYETMWGSSEFCPDGTLSDWDIRERLGEIRIPTLVIVGRDDEATPALAATITEGIPGAERLIFEKSAHFPFIEETERYLSVLDGFLSAVESERP